MPALTAIRRCRGTEEFIIQPHSWQAYGRYDTGHVFATAVRASNPWMAADAVRHNMLADGVVTHLVPIEPMPRPENTRRAWIRNNR